MHAGTSKHFADVHIRTKTLSLCLQKCAASMALTPEVQKEVDQLLEQNMPMVSKWKAMEHLLLQHGLAWRAVIHPSMMLVHPLNRGGLGVNGHSAHAKGASLLQSGFDRKFLHSSTCFELAAEETTRQKQLKFNEAMVGQPTAFSVQ